MEGRARTWRPGRPCAVGVLLAPLRRGSGDPTYRIARDGAHWRGIRTPEGAATLRIAPQDTDGIVEAQAWGPGAEWALDGVPRLLGDQDDPTGFEPHHDAVAAAWRRHPHLRFGATGLLLESLVPAILEQKVTGQEAFGAQRRLVRRYGERAPGPGADLGVWIPPTPETLRRIPSWEWARLPAEGARSRTILRSLAVADALERGLRQPVELDRRLRTIPGIGVWTSAEVRSRVLGDPDAVSFGDYHIAKDVGWALTGSPVDDDGMAELLAPYAGHRNRVVALLYADGLRRPRRGPRLAPRTHLPA